MDPYFIDADRYTLRDMNTRKQSMVLDFNSVRAKEVKLPEGLSPALLTSPDLMMLRVCSPELERMVIDHQCTVTAHTFFSRSLTDQESYCGGFAGPLKEFHGSSYYNFDQQDTASSYESLDAKYPAVDSFVMSPENNVSVKDEPQTVPDINSPPMSPIDMESQEKIKLERKRLNNRLAAAKCRKRKLERISILEDKVNVLKGENAELTHVVNKLTEQVYHLKQQVIEHAKIGCPISLACIES